MRRALLIALAASLAAAAASAQGLAPGTLKLLSKNAVLVDTASTDPFVEINATEPGKFLIVGPATLQADFRVNLKASETEGAPSILEILVGGKELKRFSIKPRASADSCKGRADAKPAASVGFLMEIDPGPHAYEFRFSGAEKGAALLLVPQSKAKRALAANAPLVPAKPAVAATPTPAAVAMKTPPPAPTPTPKSIDQIGAGTHGRLATARLDRLPREVSILGGFEVPGDSTFKASASTMVEARFGLGHSRTFAVGLEAGRTHFGGITPIDPTRATPESAINVDLTPVIAHVTWYAPLDGAVRPYLAGGGGLVYAQSSWQSRAKTINEAVVGPAADGVLGVEFDLGANDMSEGRQKILLEARESWGNASFGAHDYKDFSSSEVMLGAAFKF